MVVISSICVKYLDPLNLLRKKFCSSYSLYSLEEMICIRMRCIRNSMLCIVDVPTLKLIQTARTKAMFLLAGIAG